MSSRSTSPTNAPAPAAAETNSVPPSPSKASSSASATSQSPTPAPAPVTATTIAVQAPPVPAPTPATTVSSQVTEISIPAEILNMDDIPVQNGPIPKVSYSPKEFFYNLVLLTGQIKEKKLNKNDIFQLLAQMAKPEEWGENNYMLENYIVHTFYNILHCKKEERAKYMASYEHKGRRHYVFNTGLLTPKPEHDYIYCTLKENTMVATEPGAPPKTWKFVFHSWLTRKMFSYLELPSKMRYFTDVHQLFLDTTKFSLEEVDYQHIIKDNWKRLEPFMTKVLGPNMTIESVKNILVGSIQEAKRLCEVNYRTAVPQIYNGTFQFLLPISISGTQPELALTLEKVQISGTNFKYRASTILDLVMAYQNARLIAVPEKDWLIISSQTSQTPSFSPFASSYAAAASMASSASASTTSTTIATTATTIAPTFEDDDNGDEEDPEDEQDYYYDEEGDGQDDVYFGTILSIGHFLVKKFGFIKPDVGGENIYFNNLFKNPNYNSLKKGDRVSYKLRYNYKTKQNVAVYIECITK